MKKVLTTVFSILVTAFLLFAGAFTAIRANADGAPTLTFSSVSGVRGGTVTVTTTLANCPDVKSGGITRLTYDESALTLTTIGKPAIEVADINKADTGKKNASFATSEPVNVNGTVWTFTFTIKSDAAIGEYTVTATPSFMTDTTDHGVVAVAGKVTVACATHTPVTDKAKDATCTESGLTEGSHCSVCNTVIVAQKTVAALGHNATRHAAVAATCTTAGNVEYWSCSRCNKNFGNAACTTIVNDVAVAIVPTAHSYNAWVKGTDPSLTQTGTLTRTCKNNASHTDTFTLPVLNATDYTKKTTKAVTCTTDGTDTYTYNKDGASFVYTVTVTKLGHDFGAWTVTKAPTLTQAGTLTRTCANDATHKETYALPKLDETNYTKTVTTPANCGATGIDTYTLKADYKDAENKAFSFDVTTAKTVNGSHAVALVHHEAVAANCTTKGSVEYYSCATCGNNYSDANGTSKITTIETPVAPLAHANTLISVPASNATCKEAGTVACFKCEACGKKYEDLAGTTPLTSEVEKINPNNHVYQLTGLTSIEKTNAKEATCTTAGNSEYYTCKQCNKVYSDSNCTTTTTVAAMTIKALGHDYGEASYNLANDKLSCTARVVCQRTSCTSEQDKHEVTATATKVTSKVTTPAKCTVDGTTTYTATFADKTLFPDKSFEFTDIEKLGHDYAAPVYTWADDGSTCSAEVICKRAGCTTEETDHSVTASATISSKIKEDSTCTKKGVTTYTATFTSQLFTQQTKDVENIEKKAHTYGSGYICSVCGYVNAELIPVESGNMSVGGTVADLKDKGLDLTDVFDKASGNSAAVTVSVAGENVTVSFNAAAAANVAGSGAAPTLKVDTNAQVSAQNLSKADVKAENIHAVLDLSLGGVAFGAGNGSVTVTYPLPETAAITEKLTDTNIQIVVIYISDSGVKEYMTTTYEGGVVSFSTNHFSTYVIAYEYVCRVNNTHTFGSWSGSSIGHSHTCSICGLNATVPHTFTEVITKEPTCGVEGEKTLTCSVCSYVTTEPIEKLAHSFDNGKVTKEPTCGAEGVKTFTCGNCGETKTEAVEKLAHSFDNGKVTKEATCTEEGVKTFTCKKCGETKTEAIEKLAHKYKDGVCTVCGDVLTQEPTAPEKSGLPAWAIVLIVIGGVAVVGCGGFCAYRFFFKKRK